MTPATDATPRTTLRGRGTAGRLIAAAALALAIGTAPTFLTTFINDDASYMPIAQKLNAGALLYRDAVDNKPPLIYATFAAMLGLFGTGAIAAVKVLTAAVHLACAGLLFVIGRRLHGGRVGALAALFFAAAVVTGVAEDFAAPNTEAYMNLFALAAVAVLARDPECPSRRALLAAGALAAVATLFRLQGAAVLLGAGLFLFARRHARARLGAPPAAWLAVGFAAPIAATVAYFAARGTLGDLWLWAVCGNLSYVQIGAAHFGWRALGRIALAALAQLPLVAASIAAGAAWGRARAPERAHLQMIWLQVLAALAAYQMGTRFYGHYFLQVVPWLALLGAWAYEHLPRERMRWLRATPHLLTVWLLTFAGVNAVRLSTPGDPDLNVAAAFVKSATTPGDQVWQWSAPAQLAFHADRRFATRFPFNNYLTGRSFGTEHVLPGATRQGARALESAEGWRLLGRDLAASPPPIVVDGAPPDFRLEQYPMLRDYVARLYQPPVRVGHYRIYRRALEAADRLAPVVGD